MLIAINVVVLFLFVFTKLYYIWRNKQREAKWQALTPEEQHHYINNTTDEGNRRLDFRFAH